MTHETLIAQLVRNGVLTSPHIIAAFQHVDRANFVPAALKDQAYEDHPLPLDVGSTISQPTTVAIMFELLQPRPGQRVLDVGAGSAWTTALLAHCVAPRGSVVGTEILPELVAFGRDNLARLGIEHASIVQADATPGVPGATFDRILVSAGVETIPDALLDQLGADGVLVIPVGTGLCRTVRGRGGPVTHEVREGFVFVPLRDPR